MRLICSGLLLGMVACGAKEEALSDFDFAPPSRRPQARAVAEIDAAARSGLQVGERLGSVLTYPSAALGQTVVQAVAESPNNARAYVIDEEGEITETQQFAEREQRALFAAFGRLTPSLFDKQLQLLDTDTVTVDLIVTTDLPEPERPYDGTDLLTPIEEYEAWTRTHAEAQVSRIAAAKRDVLQLLQSNEGGCHV